MGWFGCIFVIGLLKTTSAFLVRHNALFIVNLRSLKLCGRGKTVVDLQNNYRAGLLRKLCIVTADLRACHLVSSRTSGKHSKHDRLYPQHNESSTFQKKFAFAKKGRQWAFGKPARMLSAEVLNTAAYLFASTFAKSRRVCSSVASPKSGGANVWL